MSSMNMNPLSPTASTYSQADSTYGVGKPSSYLIVKISGNGVDFSSSSRGVQKLLPDRLKIELADIMEIANRSSNPEQNDYGQMLKEVEALHLRDPQLEDVKDLRHFLPIFRKVCYIAKEDIEKKCKLKSMWSEKPADWPHDVLHVDPNNPGSVVKGKKMPKPKKPDLVKMYQFLVDRYKRVREQLWIDTFKCLPDDEQVCGEMEEYEDVDMMRNLANKVLEIYDDRNIRKLVNALLKEFETLDGISDTKTWVVYNRQKSVFESDLREALYMQNEGCAHSVDLFIVELKDICKQMNMDSDQILAASEQEEPSLIPLILDQARSPTVVQNNRRPTFKMDMEAKNEDVPAEIPVFNDNVFTQDEAPAFNNVTNVFSEDMEVGVNEEVASSPPEQNVVIQVVDNTANPQNYIANSVDRNYLTEGQQAVEALQRAHPPEPDDTHFAPGQVTNNQTIDFFNFLDNFDGVKQEPVSALQLTNGNDTFLPQFQDGSVQEINSHINFGTSWEEMNLINQVIDAMENGTSQ